MDKDPPSPTKPEDTTFKPRHPFAVASDAGDDDQEPDHSNDEELPLTESDVATFEKVRATINRDPRLVLRCPRLIDADAYLLLRVDRPGIDPKTKRTMLQVLRKVKNIVVTQKKRSRDEELLKLTALRQGREAAVKLARGEAIETDELECIKDVFTSAAPDATVLSITNVPSERPGLPEEAPPLFTTMEFTTSFESPGAEDKPGFDVPQDDKRRKTEKEEDRVLSKSRKCYTCKQRYSVVHRFYYSLCPPCGDFNFAKRQQMRDMSNKVVLLTGCRVRIGYFLTLSLLRCGATVIGTTRFAQDATSRFALEPDYEKFRDRLHLISLDLRDLNMVTSFAAFVNHRFPKLFAIINNAAQTIARPPDHHAALRAKESVPLNIGSKSDFEKDWNAHFVAHNNLVMGVSLADNQPVERLEGDRSALITQQQASGVPLPVISQDIVADNSDARDQNSWTLNLAEVGAGEASEVMLINTLSPFILNSKLKPALMNRGDGFTVPKTPKSSRAKINFDEAFPPDQRRFIINVSAMEGQFNRQKTTRHPHTNMAKAALNMMTRTSAPDYAQAGIFMNSVDTGWITDERPKHMREKAEQCGHFCPIDEVDAAARCLDLIYTDSTAHGLFWKDYRVVPW